MVENEEREGYRPYIKRYMFIIGLFFLIVSIFLMIWTIFGTANYQTQINHYWNDRIQETCPAIIEQQTPLLEYQKEYDWVNEPFITYEEGVD